MKKKEFQKNEKFAILYLGGEISHDLLPDKKVEAVIYNSYAISLKEDRKWYTSAEAKEIAKTVKIDGVPCSLGIKEFWLSVHPVFEELCQFIVSFGGDRIGRGAVWTDTVWMNNPDELVFVYPDSAENGHRNRKTNFVRPVRCMNSLS